MPILKRKPSKPAGTAVGAAAGSGKVVPLPAPLGGYLVDQGVVTRAQWEEALDASPNGVAGALRALMNRGVADSGRLLAALSDYSGLPVAEPQDLAGSEKLGQALSYQFLKRHRLVPFAEKDGELQVACADPLSGAARAAITAVTGMPVKAWLADDEAIMRRIEVHYGLGHSGYEGLGGGEDEFAARLQDLDDPDSEAPIIRLFNYMVDRAVEVGASDIHIEPEEDRVRIRYRIDGILHDQQSLSRKMQAALTSRVKIMAKLNIAERRLAQDGKIGLKVAGRDLDLRVSTLPTVHGESVVLRILYRDSLGAELTGLGMRADTLAAIEKLITRPHGLILVTGPTGSGKTTTLYAALESINDPNKKIITIEDPVEYRLNGINQIQVNSSIGLTFASGLRSIVRQDPDVILVGEIRDRETADIAIHASLTGHLVFSTLHTNDSAGAITRLQDMGVDSFLISSALTAVLAQRLVRQLCPECKEAVEYVGDHGIRGAVPGTTIWRARACPACANLGYKSRVGIFELINVSEPIRNLINQDVSSDQLRRLALEEGMRTLIEDGWKKVTAGQTSLEEVLRVTSA